MPYRRLPQTDNTRIQALQKAIEMEGYRENGELVLSYQSTQIAQQFLSKFQQAYSISQQYKDISKKSNRTYHKEMQTARLYLSHFITVMNLAIQRGELRKDIKVPYGLDPENLNVPDLSTEALIQEWGERVINAEEERTRNGGVPIYNPTIAKVKVHWGIFNDHYQELLVLRDNIKKAQTEVANLRPEADDIITEIWNQVDQFYANYPSEAKLRKSKDFGVIFYCTKEEMKKKKIEENEPKLAF